MKSHAKRMLLVFVVSLGAVLPGSAQQKRAMTPEDVIALRQVSGAEISPDGKWVAYVVSTNDMKEDAANPDIWLVSTSGGQAVQLTTSEKADTSPRWSPDGKTLGFISARDGKPQVYLISPFGGEASKLTDSKTGVESFSWSPDGSRIAYVARQELTKEEEQKEKDKDDTIVVDHNFRMNHIWVIDVKTKKSNELVKGDYSASDPQWSPDGRTLAFVTTPTPKADDSEATDIWTIGVESGNPKKLTDNPGTDAAPRWSPDGTKIAYLSHDDTEGLIGQVHLMTMSPDGGGKHQIAPGFKYQPGAATWSPDGALIYFTSEVGTTSQIFSIPSAGGEVKQISHVEDAAIGPVTFSKDASAVAFTKSDFQHPDDIYVVMSLASFQPQKLSNHNPQVEGFDLGRGDAIHWKGADGLEIEGLVIYPPNYQSGKRYPMVTLVHGGPAGVFRQSFPASWSNFGQVWAGHGWVCFYPNIRGSAGYGEKFLTANINDWGGQDYHDVQTGIDALVAKGVADPDKLAQSGWSYGGYMTAWTLTQTNRFKAVMVGAGLTDMFSMYSTDDLQRPLEGYFKGQPWDVKENYTRASALTYIKQAKTPTLIQHGGADVRVPNGQSWELYMGLKKNHIPVELVFFPREPHGLREPRHQLDKMRREYAWFSKWVLGVDAPSAEKPD